MYLTPSLHDIYARISYIHIMRTANRYLRLIDVYNEPYSNSKIRALTCKIMLILIMKIVYLLFNDLI